jgi:hypothetical protein
VQELGPFIEERGVVLIALNNEMLALLQREAAAKILCNAANKK